jgi:hypothetical protein
MEEDTVLEVVIVTPMMQLAFITTSKHDSIYGHYIVM